MRMPWDEARRRARLAAFIYEVVLMPQQWQDAFQLELPLEWPGEPPTPIKMRPRKPKKAA